MQYGLRRGWTITAPGLLCATMIAAMLMHVLTVRCGTKRFVGTATSSTHAILAEVCRVGGNEGLYASRRNSFRRGCPGLRPAVFS